MKAPSSTYRVPAVPRVERPAPPPVASHRLDPRDQELLDIQQALADAHLRATHAADNTRRMLRAVKAGDVEEMERCVKELRSES